MRDEEREEGTRCLPSSLIPHPSSLIPHPWSRWLAAGQIAVLVAVLAVYAWRLTLGVDLSDESYYAVAPVSWLRSRPAETGNLSLHQLAGALTYPFIRAYAGARPDLKGLVLALRALYGLCALGTALLAYRLLARVLNRPAAAGCAAAVLLFIPFGLPAPSYNTLGMLGLIGGACVLGAEVLRREAAGPAGLGAADWRAAALAGALAAVAAAAYPTLALLMLGALALFARLFPGQRRLVLLVLACWLAFGVVLLAAVVAGLGGPARLGQMLAFTGRLDGTLGLAGKLRLAVAMLTRSRTYLACCAAAVALGFVRRGWPGLATRLGQQAGVLAVAGWWVYQPRPPVFFARGHDLVFLLAAAGLPALPWPGRPVAAAGRVLAALYLIGVGGGLLTSATAGQALYNFCLLGLLAAVAGMAGWLAAAKARRTVLDRFLGPGWALALAGLLGWSSLVHIYGEGVPPARLVVRVRHGPFAGLRTRPESAGLLAQVSRQIAPYRAACRTADVFGRQPGLYLLTPFELRSPMPWLLQDPATRGAYGVLARHYAQAGNRPDLILWFHDLPLELNRVQVALLARDYCPVSREGPVTVYRRRDLVSARDP